MFLLDICTLYQHDLQLAETCIIYTSGAKSDLTCSFFRLSQLCFFFCGYVLECWHLLVFMATLGCCIIKLLPINYRLFLFMLDNTIYTYYAPVAGLTGYLILIKCVLIQHIYIR